MKRLPASFYAKLSALFLVLISVLGVTLAVLSVRSFMRFQDETEQWLNRSLAADLAVRLQPYLHERIDEAQIEQYIQYLTNVNRRIDIYLLDSTGAIKVFFLDHLEGLRRPHVDTRPLERFLQGAELPILGDDPRQRDGQKPFSVAEVEVEGQKGCYLYIILGGGRYDSAVAMMDDSYILQTTLRGLGLVLLITGIVGLGLFALLTRRLRRMSEIVAAFEDGQFDRRIPVRSSDELGQLAESFNQMADTLVASLEELRQTDRLRRDLVMNISHDLRSPLASIQGYLETLQMKHEALGPEERAQYLDVVLRNTRSLGLLVDQLFELSKLDARQVEPAREAFPVAELIQDVAAQFQPYARERDVALETELPASSPLVDADIAFIERALSNLLDNALRYTPPGGTVRVVLSTEPGGVRVCVADTGIGIPEEDLPHIFERFYRVEKSRPRAPGGSGLGLAIAQKTLELHGSTLHVQSEVSRGTTFCFRLPAARASRLEARRLVE